MIFLIHERWRLAGTISLGFIGLVAIGSGCTVPNPKSCADKFCSDPNFPFCDMDGSIEGAPQTCIAVSDPILGNSVHVVAKRR